VLGVDRLCDRLVIRIPAAEHLVRDGGEVLVDKPVEIVVVPVEPVFIHEPVGVIVHVPGAARVPFRGAVHDIDGVLCRPKFGLEGDR